MLDYTQEMNLKSESGYCMPFKADAINMLLGFGEQKDPRTGEKFNHTGIDLECKNMALQAMASGVVSGIFSDRKYGFTQIITYGDYDVTYRPLTQVFANIGQQVRAGQQVATSGNWLHIEVKYKDNIIKPDDFLGMVFGNMKNMQAVEGVTTGTEKPLEFATIDTEVKTKYDGSHGEIEELMMRLLPNYFGDMFKGKYKVPTDTQKGLLDTFSEGFSGGCFYETIPSLSNPLGLGRRASSIASRIMEMLIEDFLAYAAVTHRLFLSGMSEEDKKKLLTAR